MRLVQVKLLVGDELVFLANGAKILVLGPLTDFPHLLFPEDSRQILRALTNDGNEKIEGIKIFSHDGFDLYSLEAKIKFSSDKNPDGGNPSRALSFQDALKIANANSGIPLYIESGLFEKFSSEAI